MPASIRSVGTAATANVVAVGTTSSCTPGKPAGLANDDVLFMVVTGFASNTNLAFTTPSGFTHIGTVTELSGKRAGAMYRKTVTNAGSEPSTYTATITASIGDLAIDAVVWAVQGADLTSIIDVSATGHSNNTAGTTLTAPTVTTTVPNTLVMIAGGATTQVAPTFSSWSNGFTEAKDDVGLTVASKSVAGTGAVGTTTATISASSNWYAFTVAVKSAATNLTVADATHSHSADNVAFNLDYPTIRSTSADTRVENLVGTLTAYAPRPSALEDGDVLFANVVTVGTLGGATMATPSGWTLVQSATQGTADIRLFRKTVTDASSEPSATAFVGTATLATMAVDVMVVAVAGGTTTGLASAISTGGASTTLTAPTVSSVHGNSRLICFYSALTQIAPTYSSPTNGTAEFWDINGQAVTHKQLAVPGAAGTSAVTSSVSTEWAAASIAIAPSGSPVTDNDTMVVVFDGQSVNRIPVEPDSYPYVTMASREPSYAVVAINGSSWTDLSADDHLRLHPYAAVHDRSILVLAGGHADIWSADENDSAATALADMEAYADAAVAAGFDYIIATTMSASSALTGADDTKRLAFNTGIRGSSHWDAVADVAAEPEFDTLGDTGNTTYYNPDGVHWSATGAAIAAAVVGPYIDGAFVVDVAASPILTTSTVGAPQVLTDSTGAAVAVATSSTVGSVVVASTTVGFTPGVFDDYIQSSGPTYASARDGSAGLFASNSADNHFYIGSGEDTGDFEVTQAFLSFDTSSIPDDSSIIGVTLTLRSSSGADFGSGNILEVRSYDWGASLTSADYVPGDDLAALPLLASRAASTWTGSTTIDLTSEPAFLAAIDKSGLTKLLLSDSFARLAVVPGATDSWYVQVRSSDYNVGGNTSLRPRLTVTTIPNLTSTTPTPVTVATASSVGSTVQSVSSTVAAAVVSTVSAVDTPTTVVATNATAAPVVAETVSLVGAPTLSAGSSTTTTAVVTVSSVDVTALSTGSRTAAVVVATASAVAQPTITAGSQYTASSVDTIVSVPSPAFVAPATNSAAVVPTTTTVGGPTLVASSAPTPTVIASSSAVGSPVLLTGITVTTSVVATASSIGSPALQTSSTVDAASVTTASTVGLPSGAGDATINPASVATVSTVDAPTSSGRATAEATVVATTSSVGAPALQTSSSTQPNAVLTISTVGSAIGAASSNATPVAVPTTSAVGTPTVTATSVALPSTVDTTTSVGSPTILDGQSVSPASVTTTSSVGTPTFITSSTASPATVSTSSTAGGVPAASETATPAAVATTTTVPSPTPTSGAAVVATAVGTSSSVPTPSFSTTATPAVVATTAAITAPAASSNATAQVTVIEVITSVGDPVITRTSTTTPDSVVTVSSVGSTVVGSEVNASPDVVLTVVAIGSPEVATGPEVQVVLTTTGIGTPAIQTTATVLSSSIETVVYVHQPEVSNLTRWVRLVLGISVAERGLIVEVQTLGLEVTASELTLDAANPETLGIAVEAVERTLVPDGVEAIGVPTDY